MFCLYFYVFTHFFYFQKSVDDKTVPLNYYAALDTVSCLIFVSSFRFKINTYIQHIVYLCNQELQLIVQIYLLTFVIPPAYEVYRG